MALEVTVAERPGGVYMLSPSGSLDSNTHLILEKELEKVLSKSPNTVIFDLEDLKYISSIGLRIIFKIKKTMKQKGGMMVMTNLQPQVKEVFQIVSALPKEAVFESMEELDDYLLAMQKQSLENR